MDLMKIVNRKALFDYKIIEKFEAGIVLIGLEIKSIREHKVSINNAYISYSHPHVYIYNMHIGALEVSKTNEDRARILLVSKKEKNKILALVKEPKKTVVPLELYYNKKGFVKILCAIAEGKTLFDKRRSIKEREWNLEKQRIINVVK